MPAWALAMGRTFWPREFRNTWFVFKFVCKSANNPSVSQRGQHAAWEAFVKADVLIDCHHYTTDTLWNPQNACSVHIYIRSLFWTNNQGLAGNVAGCQVDYCPIGNQEVPNCDVDFQLFLLFLFLYISVFRIEDGSWSAKIDTRTWTFLFLKWQILLNQKIPHVNFYCRISYFDIDSSNTDDERCTIWDQEVWTS